MKHPYHTSPVISASAACIVIITMLSVSSFSFAGRPARTTTSPIDEPDEISTAAATALAIQAYREIQDAMIEADFRQDLRVSASSGNRQVATELAHQAVNRRAARLHKLTGQLSNMETAYNTLAGQDKQTAPPPLNLAVASAQLREIAAISIVSDFEPHKKMLVASILHPPSAKTAAAFVIASGRPYSPIASWLVSATTVAQHTEVNRSSLSLLAVLAMIVIHRISQLAGVAGTHGLMRRN